jgi:hypothetical protein
MYCLIRKANIIFYVVTWLCKVLRGWVATQYEQQHHVRICVGCIPVCRSNCVHCSRKLGCAWTSPLDAPPTHLFRAPPSKTPPPPVPNHPLEGLSSFRAVGGDLVVSSIPAIQNQGLRSCLCLCVLLRQLRHWGTEVNWFWSFYMSLVTSRRTRLSVFYCVVTL